MSRFLMGLGILLLLFGAGTFFINPAPSRVAFDMPDAIIGAMDRLAIDPDRLKAAIEEANGRADMLNQIGITYQYWAQWLLFGVFVAGSCVAFLAGLQKMFDDLKEKKGWLTIIIGLLGSLSAISSYAAGYFEGEAKGNFACISSIEKEVRQTVENIRAESDAALAEQYLGEMQRKIARCPI